MVSLGNATLLNQPGNDFVNFPGGDMGFSVSFAEGIELFFKQGIAVNQTNQDAVPLRSLPKSTGPGGAPQAVSGETEVVWRKADNYGQPVGNLPNTKRKTTRMGRFFPGRLPWWPKSGPAVFDFIHPDIENALFPHYGIGFVNRFK